MDNQKDSEDSTVQAGDKTAPLVTGGQVMDIQAPLPSTVTSPTSSAVSDESSVQPVVNNDESTSEAVTPADNSGSAAESAKVVSVKTDPASSDAAEENNAADTKAEVINEPASGDENTTAVPAQDAEATENPLAVPAAAQPKKKGSPIVAILVAVVVALALAGLVVFVYTKSKNTKQSADSSKTTNSQGIAPKPQASPSDVDATTQQLDTTLTKVDDTKDFSATDLSDTALGL